MLIYLHISICVCLLHTYISCCTGDVISERIFLTLAKYEQGQNVMALTATATYSARKVILRTLEMFDCHVIAKISSQCNITYHV